MKIKVKIENLKKYFNSHTLLFLFLSFLVWRLYVFADISFSHGFLPLQNIHLGGGLKNYLANPGLWGLANFDGEHYIAIARFGYKPLTYFFFPVYPILISAIADLIGKTENSYLIAGLLISNISFVAALFGLWKLLLIDYKKQTVLITTILILLFPTSFYFVSLYTESLFLAIVVWSLYFARKGNWLLAGVLGIFASATRLVGIIMLPTLLVEYWIQNKADFKHYRFNWKIIFALIAPLGLLLYMYFLKITTGDPLAFVNSIEIYGEQRSSSIVILPQVFYRYMFKILPVLGFGYWPRVLISWMEFLAATWLLIASALAIYKIRLSWAIYLLSGYLVSSISGSFSSLPRYSIVLFPAFLVTALYINKVPKLLRMLLMVLGIILLTLTQTMFMRGYWVS